MSFECETSSEVVLSIAAGGEELEMVREPDGTYRIVLGGVRVRSLAWPPERFHQCAAALCGFCPAPGDGPASH